MDKIYTLDENRADKANRAILKLTALARCMEAFEDREWTGDMVNGVKYIIEDTTADLANAVFWEDIHGQQAGFDQVYL
jgi:hypothetical protein